MDFKFKDSADYVAFREFLFKNAKTETVADKQKHAAIIGTKKSIICLQMSFIRQVAKNILKQDAHGFLRFSKTETYEETMIYGLVVAGLTDFDEKFKFFEYYLSVVDCWALIDSVCTSIKIKESESEKYFNKFKNLCFSEKEFVSRFGIVGLMMNFLTDKHIDEVLNIFTKIYNPAYYVQMAIAWAVSDAFIKYKEKVRALLKKQKLSKFTQNKAIAKIRESYRVSEEDKAEILNFKIK